MWHEINESLQRWLADEPPAPPEPEPQPQPAEEPTPKGCLPTLIGLIFR